MSLFLDKPGRGPRLVLKSDSTDGHMEFDTGGMPNMSLSKTVAIQQPSVYQHILVLSIPHAFSSVNSTLCLQSSGKIQHIFPMIVNKVSSNTRQPLECEDRSMKLDAIQCRVRKMVYGVIQD